jgi:hypothetical protein
MAAQSTYTPIATYSPSTAAISITSIPQTYTDLVLVVYARDTSIPGPKTQLFYGFNGLAVSGTYTWTAVGGDGTTGTSVRGSANQFSSGVVPGTSATAGQFATTTVHITNYTSTSMYKHVLQRGAGDYNGSGDVNLTVGIWQNTAAVTQIDLRNTFAAGSMITLYGIKAA